MSNTVGEYRFVEASLELVGEPDVLNTLANRRHRMTVRDQLSDIIEAEGPIEEQRLARVLGYRFGLSRVSQSRIAQILACTSTRPERNRRFGTFYWPSTIVPDRYTGFRPRYDTELTLSVNEISHRELGNAMVDVLRKYGALSESDLLRETMWIFGWYRMGYQIRERLEAVLSWAVSNGLIARARDSSLSLPAQSISSYVDQPAGSIGGDSRSARSPHEAFATGQFGAWVLTCNPRVFNPRNMIESEYTETAWTVNQRAASRTSLMEPGQRVLLWVTSGSDEFSRGVWGAGTLTAPVATNTFNYSEGWVVDREREQEMFVELEMDLFRDPVEADQLLEDDLLAGIEPLRAPQVTPGFLTLAELERLNELMEVSYKELPPDPLPENWRRLEKRERPLFEHRRKTELIAMSVVTEHYEGLGYSALDVSRDRVGWDITFVSEVDGTKNVEVKGLSRSRPVVSLTRNELRKARSNPHWQLIVITDAHDDERRTARFYSREAVRAARSEKRFRRHSKALMLDFSTAEPDIEIRV